MGLEKKIKSEGVSGNVWNSFLGNVINKTVGLVGRVYKKAY